MRANRNMNGDGWMEWPDFIFRWDACHKRLKRVNNILEKQDEDTAQE